MGSWKKKKKKKRAEKKRLRKGDEEMRGEEESCRTVKILELILNLSTEWTHLLRTDWFHHSFFTSVLKSVCLNLPVHILHTTNVAAVIPNFSINLHSIKPNNKEQLWQDCCSTSPNLLFIGLTFQGQGLPNPKLFEHDNKQPDNNSNGNYFHAIQSHGCLALDTACAKALFKKLTLNLISLYHPKHHQLPIISSHFLF